MKGKKRQQTPNPKRRKPESRAKVLDSYRWWKDRNSVMMILLVLIATFIIFSPNLKYDFVNWDDNVNVYENQDVKDLSADGIKKIFTSTVIGGYTPLTILTFAVEYHFVGYEPFLYHLDNIILHMINTLLIFWLMLLLGLKRPWALVAAVLFAIHPMRVESVAWVTERKDVLYGLFFLASIISYIYYFKTKKIRFSIFSYLFFILSLLSKIQAVSLPLCLLLVDYIMRRPLRFKLLVEKIPYFLFSLAIGFAGIYFLREQESLGSVDYTFFERILVASYSLVVYMVKSIYPYEMSAIYPFILTGHLPFYYYIAPLIVLAVGFTVYFTAKYGRVLVFGSLFFLVNIIFLLQVVNAGQGFIADRFTYIAYIGLFFAYSKGFQWVYDHRHKLRPLLALGLGIYVILLGITTWNRNAVWKNTETLFTDVIEKHPKVAAAYENRGRFYRENKLMDKALADFNSVIALTPEDHKVYVGRGRVYFEQGNYDRALEDFNKALELNDASSMALSNRGAIYAMRGRYDEALHDLSRAIELSPELKDAYQNRSLLYFNLQEYQKCLDDCAAYDKLAPRDPDNINMIAVCQVQLKNNEEAMRNYDLAIKLEPKQGVFYLNRSYLFKQMGDKDKALQDAQNAIRFGTSVDTAYLQSLR